jgi:hypothetical protein
MNEIIWPWNIVHTLEITVEIITKFGCASDPKIEIQFILETD